MWSVLFFPEQASRFSRQVDALMLYVLGVALFFSFLIAVLIIYFAIKYRFPTKADRSNPVYSHVPLEIVWTGVPLFLTLTMFAWGANIFVRMHQPPANAMDIYVLGKRWMWKMQHPEGQREINELHVPVGRPVRLLMTSQDVIHSFFVPDFRMKQDVLPGRYTSEWFEAVRPGRYHLFCSQYCGTSHASMTGWIIAMAPAAYQSWLSGGTRATMPALGETLFGRLGCATCHRSGDAATGPSLAGLFGKHVRFADGASLTADENYIRESILNPRAHVVAGYRPVMPTFQGQIDDVQMQQLIAYIKSLGKNS